MDDGLTEDEVIQGTATYLLGKGKTTKTEIRKIARASRKEHGVDLCVYKGTPEGRGNLYFVEAKGNLKVAKDNLREAKKSNFLTEFRWGISQIILRIDYASNKNNRIYGIAIPKTEPPRCLRLIRDNWALKTLGIRLFCAYRDDNGELFAQELTPSKIYTEVKGK